MTPAGSGASGLSEAAELARLRLVRTEGIGPANWRRMLARFGSPEAAIRNFSDYAGRAGVKAALADPDAVWREREALHRMGGRFLHLGEAGYPPLLARLPDAPPVLAVLGDAGLLTRRAVAVVGARNASAAGRRIAEEIGLHLARAGLVTVSGLARGIDAAAHEGALRGGTGDGAAEAGPPRAGPTVAVVPGGLDVAYPPENAALQRRIGEVGALVAESPLGTAPLSRHFPRRNRIVAGLSLGVVVIEAALNSGTLITARLAVEQGREVYAVPGSPLDPRCRGSNDLLRQGATFCEGVEDVLATLPESPSDLAPRAGAALPLLRAGKTARASVAGPEGVGSPPGGADQILELIGPTPTSVDEVLRRCHLSPPSAQAILLELELAGEVELLPGNRIVRLRAAGAGSGPDTRSGSA